MVCRLKYIRLYKKSSLDQQDKGVSQFYEACEQSLLIQSKMFVQDCELVLNNNN